MGELFLKLLDMSLAASWLIAAVVILRLLLKKAPKWVRGILWALVAVRLICPFSFESNLSLVPDVGMEDAVDAVVSQAVRSELENAVAEIGGVDGPVVTFEAEIGGSVVQGGTPGDSVVITPVSVTDLASALWLAGMVVLLLYALIRYLRLRRRVSAAMLLRENIWLCDGVESPFILGLFRPRIYLPSSITGEDMGHVVAHERAHLARRDHWWKPLGFVLLAVYWFNPLIWAAYILLCRDIELACDEKVIKSPDIDRKGYSEALLNCSVRRSAITACPLAFGEVSVRGRIKSVLNYKKPAFWLIIAALVACIVLAVCFLTDPIKPTVHDVADQKGYKITAMTTNVAMPIKIPTDVLGDDIYSNEGHLYEPDEVVVYQTETTRVYLERVGYLEQYGEEKLYFDFCFDYEIPSSGTVRVLSTPNIKDGKTTSYSMGGGVANKLAWDSMTSYPEGARLYGVSQGVQVSVAIKTDVVRNAHDYIAFTMMDLTDITYEKGPANHEDKIVLKDASAEVGYLNGMAMQGLEIGEETVYPHPIVFFENGGWLDYQFTYGRSGLTVEYGLQSTDGMILSEKIEGGQGIGRIKDIPAGAYELFFRNCEDNIVAVEAGNTVTGAFNFTCGGEYGFAEETADLSGLCLERFPMPISTTGTVRRRCWSNTATRILQPPWRFSRPVKMVDLLPPFLLTATQKVHIPVVLFHRKERSCEGGAMNERTGQSLPGDCSPGKTGTHHLGGGGGPGGILPPGGYIRTNEL